MKQFQLVIGFDKVEADMFGGLRTGTVALRVSEEVKNQVLEVFNSGSKTISVTVPGGVIHLNCRNILYISEKEIPMNSGVEEKKSDV